MRGGLVSLKDPERNEYSYRYDSLGNLVDVMQNGKTTTHNRYNALSWKLTEESELDSKKETYAYNVTGDVVVQTDKAGNQHKYEYTPFYEPKTVKVYTRTGEKLYSQDKTTKNITSLLTWSAGSGKAATVENGLITASAKGKETIKGTYGKKSVSIVVTVK